jgi:hypothetical protein
LDFDMEILKQPELLDSMEIMMEELKKEISI